MDEHIKKPWKYCYWLTEEHLEQLKAHLQAQGIEMARAKQNPCEILLAEIGYAEPATWSLICRFDAAPWYGASQRHLRNRLINFLRRLSSRSRLIRPAFPRRRSKRRLPLTLIIKPASRRAGERFQKKWGKRLSKGWEKCSGPRSIPLKTCCAHGLQCMQTLFVPPIEAVKNSVIFRIQYLIQCI